MSAEMAGKTSSTEHNEPMTENKRSREGSTDLHSSHASDAQIAASNEHALTVLQAIRAYPWAIFWAFWVCMTIIMEGYSTILIGNFYAYPTFTEKYGFFVDEKVGYQISGAWQVAIGNASMIGSVIGALMNGYLIGHFGYRLVMLASLVFMAGFVFVTFFAPNIQTVMVGQLLCGIPWGVFATIGSSYASEVVPLKLRGYLTAYTNMCFAMGQLIGGGVLSGLVSRTDEWGYRIPFAIQWIWPAPLILILWFMPESPWHLVRNGQLDLAERSLSRLASRHAPSTSAESLAYIIHTTELERHTTSGSSYSACFRGTDRRRTEIACMTFCAQITCGSQFAFTSTYFLRQAGMNVKDVYNMNFGGTAISFIGTLVVWLIMARVGRRKIYLYGMSGMCVCLVVIGVLGTLPEGNGSTLWAAAGAALAWLLIYSISIGPVGWTIPAEVSSTNLRAKTICFARFSYYLTTIGANAIEPYMVNPTQWNLKGKTSFVWLGTALVWLLWAYLRLPETKDRTFEELHLLFDRKVPARKFKSTHVNAYEERSDRAHA